MLGTYWLKLRKDYVRGTGAGSCFNWPNTGSETFYYPLVIGPEVVSSVKLPGWRQRIARGMSATTLFVGTDIKLQHTPGFCVTKRWCNAVGAKSWSEETLSGNLSGTDVSVPAAPVTTIDPTANAQALATFVKRARERQGAFRGSNFAVELRQTLGMLRRPAQALRRGIDAWSSTASRVARRAAGTRSLDNLSSRQRRNVARALSGSWLETSFGWLPLASDISDANKALRGFADRESQSRVSATSTSEGIPSIAIAGEGWRNVEIRTEVHTKTELSVRYYGAVKVRAEGPFMGAVAENFGFRIRDFVPALWEAIPYSFLVDYFVNIGEVLDAWSFPRSDMAWVARVFRNTTIRDCSRMTYRKLTTLNLPLTNTIKVEAFVPSATIIRRSYVHRDVYGGTLVPSFRFKIPGTSTKFLNIASLALQRRVR